jgi:hypothetical protein
MVGLLFCKPCQRSYDRFAGREGTTHDLIKWVAERARKFKKCTREHQASFVPWTVPGLRD